MSIKAVAIISDSSGTFVDVYSTEACMKKRISYDEAIKAKSRGIIIENIGSVISTHDSMRANSRYALNIIEKSTQNKNVYSKDNVVYKGNNFIVKCIDGNTYEVFEKKTKISDGMEDTGWHLVMTFGENYCRDNLGRTFTNGYNPEGIEDYGLTEALKYVGKNEKFGKK